MTVGRRAGLDKRSAVSEQEAVFHRRETEDAEDDLIGPQWARWYTKDVARAMPRDGRRESGDGRYVLLKETGGGRRRE